MKRFSGFLFSLILCCCFRGTAQIPDSLLLMPRPQNIKLMTGKFYYDARFTVGIHGPESAKLLASVNRFYQFLGKRTNIYFQQEFITNTDDKPGTGLSVAYAKSVTPVIGMDESYSLEIGSTGISLRAATDIGAMRGLETLCQLITADAVGYYCPFASITDAPRFKWRGLMIDAARHFIPMDVLKRNIDAMFEVKMNVLHLHLSDDEGFRVESKTYPLLQQKGSNGSYYTQDEIKGMVRYAHERGIIVVPEFDLPGHSTSILAAYPYLASYPAAYKPARRFNFDTIKNLNLGSVMKLLATTATPTIDPSKETTYIFFDNLFKEMSGLFPDAYLHIGADENNGAAWRQNPAIAAFMNKEGLKSTDELQAYFVRRLYTLAKKYNKRLIGWEEAFNNKLPEDVIIQKWKPSADDSLANSVIGHHNQLLISNGFYLDLSMPAYIHYLNEPVGKSLNAAAAEQGILGCEAAVWSELVNADNEELRVWPRAAAVAERMWSAAKVQNVDDMYRRLWATNFELNERGLEEEANYNRIIALWINSPNIMPIKVVAGLYTPIKGYKRLMSGMLTLPGIHANLASPMVRIADVVHCDSKSEWAFRNLVAEYLATHDAAVKQKLTACLQLWLNNKESFNELAVNSPYLKQIKGLSDNVSEAAAIGLLALKQESSPNGLSRLEELNKPLFDVQLTILEDISALLTGKLKPYPLTYPLF